MIRWYICDNKFIAFEIHISFSLESCSSKYAMSSCNKLVSLCFKKKSVMVIFCSLEYPMSFSSKSSAFLSFNVLKGFECRFVGRGCTIRDSRRCIDRNFSRFMSMLP